MVFGSLNTKKVADGSCIEELTFEARVRQVTNTRHKLQEIFGTFNPERMA